MIKKQTKLFLVIFLLLSFLYFFTRLFGLTKLPVFADEAIYLRWSQVIRAVESLRFLPLTDGKQPLFMWAVIPFQKIFSDPLWAGRFLSVLAGWGTLLGIFLSASVLLSWEKIKKLPQDFAQLLNPRLFLFTSLVYIFSPFSFFFDRLALADNLLSMFGSLALFLSLLQARLLRLDLSLLLGLVLGAAWLTKSPAIFFILLSVSTIIFPNIKLFKKPNPQTLRLLFFVFLSSALAFLVYNILRLGPQFHMIALRNKDYLWTLTEVLRHPLDPLKPHLSDILTWYQTLLPLPLLLLSLFALFFASSSLPLLPLLLIFAWWLAPLFSAASLARVFTARYILYTLPPLLTLATLGLYQSFKNTSQKKLRLLFLPLILLALFQSSRFFWRFTTNPFIAHLPDTESGYLETWTSGWGIKESADYLLIRAQENPVVVGTEGSFGTLPDGLQIYVEKVPHLTVVGLGLDLGPDLPQSLLQAESAGDEAYLLFNKSRFRFSSASSDNLQEIFVFPKPDGDALILYRLHSN